MIGSKTIIFCGPSDFGFSDIIKSELQQQGFTVYDFPISDTRYKYKRFSERLLNIYKKTILRDYAYKRKLKMAERNRTLTRKLKRVSHADYALFIRPDLFPLRFVENVKSKVDKIVGYQWDGLQRFPEVADYIDLFDRFFVFDAEDLASKKGLLPLTNFFIEKTIPEIEQKSAYFIASYDDYRFELIKKIKEILDSEKVDSQLYLITPEDKQIQNLQNAGLPIEEPLTYQENIERVEKASILVDIHSPIHSGLSFRVFEALNYNKKLITTNRGVRNYDFYHPNNIFIWDTTSSEGIADFLKAELVETPYEIKHKYSFSNWISYVLDIGDYSAIELSNCRQSQLSL